MNIHLDRQTVSQRCPQCNVDFTVVRGSVFDDGQPVGLYLIALHGHAAVGPIAHAAIALLDPAKPDQLPVAAAIAVSATVEEHGFSAVDWAESPWRSETYLGEMLDRSAVLASGRRGDFFHVAQHLAEDLPEVRAYFGAPAS